MGGTTGSGGMTGSGGVAGSGGTTGGGGAGGSGMSTQGITCTPETWDTAPIGWATLSGGTSGGGSATVTTVTTLSQFNAAAGGSSAAVIHVSGKLSGTAHIGSNKTIWGLCGAEIDGSVDMTGSSNVIIRNLKVVGFNCTDNSNCSAGADAVHVEAGNRHLWFDHMDISDGSDGTLDITHGSDFITISWTKFHYSGRRSGGHQFCNLIGHDDNNAAEDTGHLNVTFHHVWWADNVNQRMPRVRFGKVHLFNNLYTAQGDAACIELGVSANIRYENNVFIGVSNTVDTTHSDSASVIQAIGNIGSSTNVKPPAFTPPYPYSLDAASAVQSAVQVGAGPH
jgi:pectate lyase